MFKPMKSLPWLNRCQWATTCTKGLKTSTPGPSQILFFGFCFINLSISPRCDVLLNCCLFLAVLSSALTFLATNSFGQTFSGTATAATSNHPGGQTYGNLDLSGGSQTFIDLH